MNFFKYILIFLLVTSFGSGCKKYLSEEPKKQTSVQNTDQLEALADNNKIFVDNIHSPAYYFCNDDMDVSMATYAASPSLWTVSNLMYYMFDINQIASQTSDAFWNGEYKKILTANVILENVNKVSGSPEAKEQLKADAHLFRAFAFWQLANTYCLPYNAKNASSPGVPLKSKVDYGESLERGTLQQTFDQIEADLVQAKTTAAEDVNPNKPWRASKRAVEAMLSRFYLFTGAYDKSLEQSNLAFSTKVATVVDFNTLAPGMPQTLPPVPTITLNYSELNDWRTGAKYNFYKEFFLSRTSYNSSQWQIPSNQLVNLFDKANDLRYKYLMIENGNRRFFILSPVTHRYTFFGDGTYQPIGPTVAEILLNKAEALARNGKVEDAMSTANLLRAKRMKTYIPLQAANQAEAIARVLEERRREMPFSLRWHDLRRFNANDYAADDVSFQRTFYKIENGSVNINATETVSITPESKVLALPINNTEITASQGQIQQNNY